MMMLGLEALNQVPRKEDYPLILLMKMSNNYFMNHAIIVAPLMLMVLIE